ncbi:hypothetical protein KC19_8G097600, partial [Ceratodon purpureus]
VHVKITFSYLLPACPCRHASHLLLDFAACCRLGSTMRRATPSHAADRSVLPPSSSSRLLSAGLHRPRRLLYMHPITFGVITGSRVHPGFVHGWYEYADILHRLQCSYFSGHPRPRFESSTGRVTQLASHDAEESKVL